MGRLVPLLVLALTLSGCPATVGTRCTEDDFAAATTPVYAIDGTPAYPGQALLLTSCGGGSFCHSEGATMRVGAPHDLNFDPILADSPGFPDLTAGSQRLLRITGSIHRHRDDIYETVVDGSMPPGEAGAAVQRDPYRYYVDEADPTGMPVPSLGTADGREILRNWLACGSPMVELEYEVPAIECDSDADCTVTHDCDEGLGECAPVGSFVAHRVGVTSPTWSYLYPAIIRPSCAIAMCHGSANAGSLNLSDQSAARLALIDVESVLPGCGTRVVPGDPDASFLIEKFLGPEDPAMCGSLMPISTVTLTEEQIDLFRTWIMNGALDD